VLLETVPFASASADAIEQALDVIFGGFPIGLPP
jgi:hypothetical protein